MTKKVEKKWYQSKTKISAVLIGLAPVLTIVAGMLNGQIDLATGLTKLTPMIGMVLGIMGIRDLPFINKQ